MFGRPTSPGSITLSAFTSSHRRPVTLLGGIRLAKMTVVVASIVTSTVRLMGRVGSRPSGTISVTTYRPMAMSFQVA